MPNELDSGRETFRAYIQAGATHLVIYLTPPFPADIVARLAAEVAEPLLAAG
jgi:hypothetical protein